MASSRPILQFYIMVLFVQIGGFLTYWLSGQIISAQYTYFQWLYPVLPGEFVHSFLDGWQGLATALVTMSALVTFASYVLLKMLTIFFNNFWFQSPPGALSEDFDIAISRGQCQVAADAEIDHPLGYGGKGGFRVAVLTPKVAAEETDGALFANSFLANIMPRRWLPDPGIESSMLTWFVPLNWLQLKVVRRKPADDEKNIPPLTQLGHELMGILVAHREWPAAVSGHHGGETLLNHTIRVTKEMNRRSNNHRLSTVLGLAHDIGKVLSYKYDASKKRWDYADRNHKKYCLTILRNIPAFWDLSDADRDMIRFVLEYAGAEHQPHVLRTNQEFVKLCRALVRADSVVTHDEYGRRSSEKEDQREREQSLTTLVHSALASLNINDYRNKVRACGWYQKDDLPVIVTASNLMRKVRDIAPEPIIHSFKLDTQFNMVEHADFVRVAQSYLRAQGALLSRFGREHSSTGLWNVRVGTKTFYQCIFIDPNEYIALTGLDVEVFGRPKYGVHVLGEAR